MYPNVKAEMARNDWTLEKLAPLVGVSEDRPNGYTVGTLSAKIRGDQPITVADAKDIRRAIAPHMTLEELFKTRAELEAVV